MTTHPPAPALAEVDERDDPRPPVILPMPGAWSLEVEPFEEAADLEPEPAVSAAVPKLRLAASTGANEPTPPPIAQLIEAILFAAPSPVLAGRAAELIRGLDVPLLAEVVGNLNRRYRASGRPYQIENTAQGYRLTLRLSLRGLAQRLQGQVKEARLTPAAVETLAVVAYKQPAAKAVIDALRGEDSDTHLRTLVRRGLITIKERGEAGAVYVTTPRFLQVVRLRAVEELPRADDLARL